MPFAGYTSFAARLQEDTAISSSCEENEWKTVEGSHRNESKAVEDNYFSQEDALSNRQASAAELSAIAVYSNW